MTDRKVLFVGVVTVALTLAAAGGSVYLSHRTPAYTCVAGADEQCASDEFVREWKEFKELSDKYQAPKDVQIRMKGLVADLQPQIPAGYQWDDKKLRFVKTPQPKVVPSSVGK